MSKQDYTVKLPVIPGHPIQLYALLIGLKLRAKSKPCETRRTNLQGDAWDYRLFAQFIISLVIKHLQCLSFAVLLLLRTDQIYCIRCLT